MPFQPSLIFAIKVGAYSSGALLRGSTLGTLPAALPGWKGLPGLASLLVNEKKCLKQ